MRTGKFLVAALVLVVLVAGCLDASTGPRQLPTKAPYLLADRFPTFTIHVYHVEGWAPTAFALDGVWQEMARATGRNLADVNVVPSRSLGSLSAGGNGRWDAEEFEALFATIEPREGSPELALAFLDGGIERTDDVTPWGTALLTMALVFTEQFENQNTVTVGGTGIVPRFNREEIERAVAIHELGHTLGLVDSGVPRRHGPVSEDACECHSGDTKSVMYKSADSDANPAFLAGVESATISYRFTADDIADIRDFQAEWGFVPR